MVQTKTPEEKLTYPFMNSHKTETPRRNLSTIKVVSLPTLNKVVTCKHVGYYA